MMIAESVQQLVQILEKTISPDQAELLNAQTYLESAAVTNLPEFLKTLSVVLADSNVSAVARRQAGLQLKNRLSSNDENVRRLHEERWLSFSNEVRINIKTNIVACLGTEDYRPSAAAQCIQAVAMIELERGLWPELIPVLVHKITDEGSSDMCKEASLVAVGYICQDVERNVLTEKSNEILTAIVSGMNFGQQTSNGLVNSQHEHVRLAATNAMLNSLEFTRSNFEHQEERNVIMQVVCEATQAPDVQTKIVALQCLVKIMSLYYEYMESYMGPALFAITLEAMKSDVEGISLQGIEFWSSVCDEEIDLHIEMGEAASVGKTPEHVSRYYARGALQFISPLLMQTLAIQEEIDDDDDWNPSKAAGVCLMLLATCCEDEIIQYVIPFVKDNVKSSDWRFRDAALMAFGSILEGPEPSSLKPIIEQAITTVIELMNDESVVVKDTSAWTLGRICERCPDAVLKDAHLRPLLEALGAGLAAEPRVAANVCWAFTSLAEAAYAAASADLTSEDDTPATYALSPYFDPIIQKLLETTDRPDAGSSNLRSAAYEALMEMVRYSAQDCYVMVQNVIMIILERLQQVMMMESRIQSQNDRTQFNELQSLLCASLQSILRKVVPEHAPQISDTVMTSLLPLFQSPLASNGHKTCSGVQEDALMAVSTLVGVLGEGFSKYMETFVPFLMIGLRNVAEHQVCHSAVGVVGDLCRALGTGMIPYCDDIMNILMENLSSGDVHRNVKPQVISVFSDVSLAIGQEFSKYSTVVLNTLMQASQATVDVSNYEMMEYLNELREACLEAYTGIIQGLRVDIPNMHGASEDALLTVQPHVPYIIQFITVVAKDPEHSDACVAACAGLVGDLCTAFGTSILPYIEVEPIAEVLTMGRRSKHSKTKTLSQWATKEIRKLKHVSVNATSIPS